MASFVNTKKGFLFPLLLFAVLIFSLFPIYWIVITSLKTPVENISRIPTLFPQKISFENYAALFKGGYLKHVWNSIFVTASATILSLLLAFLAAYALARHRFLFHLNTLFLIWIILSKMLPPVVLAVPLYDMFTKMRLLNNLWGLILVFQVYTLPYCVWMLFGFVKSIPLEFEEAAEIDGASQAQIVRLIALPLIRTGLAATAIFCVIVAWDEFLFTMLFIRTPDLLTLPLVIVNFIGEFETLWGQLMGVGILAILPIIVFSKMVYRQMTSAYSLSLK
jgi:multiple sugar transport system permease protein